jgi:ABC-type Fe3+ transport system permease subunit
MIVISIIVLITVDQLIPREYDYEITVNNQKIVGKLPSQTWRWLIGIFSFLLVWFIFVFVTTYKEMMKTAVNDSPKK